MDWIDDWEEPDTDLAYEPQAFANRHVGREPAAIAMTTQVTTKNKKGRLGVPMRMPLMTSVASQSWKMRKEDQH